MTLTNRAVDYGLVEEYRRDGRAGLAGHAKGGADE